MKIEEWYIADVQPYETNSRHNNAAVDALARSIQEFGFRQPIGAAAVTRGTSPRSNSALRTVPETLTFTRPWATVKMTATRI